MESTETVAKDVPETEFVRQLNLFDSVMVVVGIMIGSGVFIVSADTYCRRVGRLDVSIFRLLLSSPATP